MYLNVTTHKYLYMYVYNSGQLYVPSEKEMFGGHFRQACSITA